MKKQPAAFITFALLGILLMANSQLAYGQTTSSKETSSKEEVHIRTAVVFSINDIEVPAMVKGFMREMLVEEGDYVEVGQLIGQLDTRSIENELKSAQIRLANAIQQADDNSPIEYARASLDVATQEYESEQGLKGTGATTSQELRRKRLAMTQAQLQLVRSEAQKKIDSGAVDLERQAVSAVQDLLDRHSIKAPFSGEIIKISNRVGEYVQEGETVVRLVDSSKVKVEGQVNSAEHNEFDLRGKPVTVTLSLAGGETKDFQGTITSIGLEHQFGRDGSVFVVQAVVENQKVKEQWLLHPKATVEMHIHLNQ